MNFKTLFTETNKNGSASFSTKNKIKPNQEFFVLGQLICDLPSKKADFEKELKSRNLDGNFTIVKDKKGVKKLFHSNFVNDIAEAVELSYLNGTTGFYKDGVLITTPTIQRMGGLMQQKGHMISIILSVQQGRYEIKDNHLCQVTA
jgi:hypothetical protein